METTKIESPEIEEIMGYMVEKTGDDKRPYRFHGKRGAIYTLIRHPRDMYVINSNGNISAIKGNYTWTDRKGKLVPINY